MMNTAESNNKTKTWETIGLETRSASYCSVYIDGTLTASSPLLNLSDPNLPFRACLVAPMDFNQTNSKAANDDGTCSSVFSNECVTDMNKFLKNYAEEQAKGASSRTNCGGLGMLISRNVTSCKGISGSFTSGTFTGGQSKTKAGCEPFNAGRSGPGTGSLFGWSNGIQDGFMRYDNAITTPAPLFVIAWRNKTTGGGLWSDSRFMCVAANVTKAGSRSVQEARKSGAARLGVTSGLFIGLMSLLVVVL